MHVLNLLEDSVLPRSSQVLKTERSCGLSALDTCSLRCSITCVGTMKLSIRCKSCEANFVCGEVGRCCTCEIKRYFCSSHFSMFVDLVQFYCSSILTREVADLTSGVV